MTLRKPMRYEIVVGSLKCVETDHRYQCVPPNRYISWYIWTKEGFKIQTSLNYNCDKVESKEGGLRRDEVENKDLRER